MPVNFLVKWCKDTKIIIRNTYDHGIKTKDEGGNVTDIKNDKLVSVWGESQGGTIIAETVVVFKFN
jgi:hypothetical protein